MEVRNAVELTHLLAQNPRLFDELLGFEGWREWVLKKVTGGKISLVSELDAVLDRAKLEELNKTKIELATAQRRLKELEKELKTAPFPTQPASPPEPEEKPEEKVTVEEAATPEEKLEEKPIEYFKQKLQETVVKKKTDKLIRMMERARKLLQEEGLGEIPEEVWEDSLRYLQGWKGSLNQTDVTNHLRRNALWFEALALLEQNNLRVISDQKVSWKRGLGIIVDVALKEGNRQYNKAAESLPRFIQAAEEEGLLRREVVPNLGDRMPEELKQKIADQEARIAAEERKQQRRKKKKK